MTKKYALRYRCWADAEDGRILTTVLASACLEQYLSTELDGDEAEVNLVVSFVVSLASEKFDPSVEERGKKLRKILLTLILLVAQNVKRDYALMSLRNHQYSRMPLEGRVDKDIMKHIAQQYGWFSKSIYISPTQL